MSCSAPPSSIPHSGPCQPPVADCHHPNGLPELANHTFRNTPTASEDAFVNRYTKLGGRRRSTRRTTRRTTRQTTNRKRRNQKRRTRARTPTQRNKHRGGVGFRLDLSACPDGGIAHPVQYETKASGGGRKRTVRRRGGVTSPLSKCKRGTRRNKHRGGAPQKYFVVGKKEEVDWTEDDIQKFIFKFHNELNIKYLCAEKKGTKEDLSQSVLQPYTESGTGKIRYKYRRLTLTAFNAEKQKQLIEKICSEDVFTQFPFHCFLQVVEVSDKPSPPCYHHYEFSSPWNASLSQSYIKADYFSDSIGFNIKGISFLIHPPENLADFLQHVSQPLTAGWIISARKDDYGNKYYEEEEESTTGFGKFYTYIRPIEKNMDKIQHEQKLLAIIYDKWNIAKDDDGRPYYYNNDMDGFSTYNKPQCTTGFLDAVKSEYSTFLENKIYDTEQRIQSVQNKDDTDESKHFADALTQGLENVSKREEEGHQLKTPPTSSMNTPTGSRKASINDEELLARLRTDKEQDQKLLQDIKSGEMSFDQMLGIAQTLPIENRLNMLSVIKVNTMPDEM